MTPDAVALPTLGGTLPLWVFTETLGIPALWIPAANSDNQQHDVSETLRAAALLYAGCAVRADRGGRGLFDDRGPRNGPHTPRPSGATA